MRAQNSAAQALLARIQAGEQIPAVQLVEFGFAEVERYTTAGCPLQWGGHTWQPLGLYIEPIEDIVGDMPGVTFVLPGVSEASIALALVAEVEGKTARIYDALVDPGTGEVAQAVLAWSGEMDVPGIEDGARATVNITAEHRGSVAVRPKPSRYTDDEQRRLYAGDTSLDFDPATDAAPIRWPAATFFFR